MVNIRNKQIVRLVQEYFLNIYVPTLAVCETTIRELI